jgi:signal transduction histidine kinase
MMLDRYFVRITQRSEALAARPRSTGVSRFLLVTTCACAITGIAYIDYLTDVRVSLAVFYLIPTVVAGVLVGPSAGLLLSAQSAVAWVLADSLINGRHDSLWLLAGNTVLRFLPLSLVVLLLADLRRLLERTQRSEQQTREFLAFAAHQLRTPVAGVQATAEALILRVDGRAEDHESEQLLSNLAGEASRVGRLVRSLLRVARLDQGEALDVRAVDVLEICQSEADRFRHVSTVAIDVHAAPGIPPVLDVDAADVAEILGNLLENACRHADRRVCVGVEVVDERERAIQVSVRDDGPGLPPGCEERAFERFVSLDRHGGSGLGLAIARSLAGKHSGTLVYEERAFIVTLPLR